MSVTHYGQMTGEAFIHHFEGPRGRAHPIAEWEAWLYARMVAYSENLSAPAIDPEIAKVRAYKDAVLKAPAGRQPQLIGLWRVIAPFVDRDGI